MAEENSKTAVNLFLAWVCLSFVNTLHAEVLMQAADFDPDKWVDSFQPISIQLTHVPNPSTGRLAFFIESHDVTALMKQTAQGEYQYRASVSPLPPGENTLKVFLVHDDNQWTELATMPFRVLTAAGFEASEISPRLDINGQFQATEESSDFDPNPDTVKNKSLTMQGGLSTRHVRHGFEIQSNWNLVSSSVQEEALRFGEKQNDAPRVDLSDYLIEVKKGDASLQLGHVSYGNHPLLMSGVSNRGVTAAWRAMDKFDLSVSAQNGQAITGATNLLGFNNYADNRINGLAAGVDLFDGSAGQVRIELTYLDAKITSQDNFNFGEVTDAELSSGLGLVVRANNASGRLRSDIAFARSTFQNPADPFLEQDFDLVESTETTDNARSVRIEYDLLQASYDSDSTPWSLTVSLTHSQTDPFYNSAGAFITPDLQDNGIAFAGQAGPVNWQLQYNETRDNLDDLATVLTTQTDNTVLSVSLPVKELFASESSYVPESLSIDYQKNHQFGRNLPTSFDPDSHIPDQMNDQYSLGFQWQISQSSVGYTFSQSEQDNRQVGRENADFNNTDHGLSFDTPLLDNLNANLSLNRAKAEDKEQDLDRNTSSASLGLDWMISERLSVSANLSKTTEDDSQDLATNDSDSAQAQLSYQFQMPNGAGRKLPIQTFIRYSRNTNKSVDNQFQFNSNTENRALNIGLSISFF